MSETPRTPDEHLRDALTAWLNGAGMAIDDDLVVAAREWLDSPVAALAHDRPFGHAHPCEQCDQTIDYWMNRALSGSSDPEAAGPELPPTIERVEYSAWYQATCTTPGAAIADWAGFSGSREDSVIVEAVAHVLDTGHETAVERTSSVHYRALTEAKPESPA